MRQVKTVYDGLQHCTSTVTPLNKSVATDCPHTGKGEEISPTNLMAAALGGCVLMSMGVLAMQSNLDISGACADVNIASTDKPPLKFKTVSITVTMPKNFDKRDRIKLEVGANACPIKHSLDPNIEIALNFDYPE
jgi:putative redox protein